MRISGIFLVLILFTNVSFAVTCPSGFDDVTANYASAFYGKDGDTCPSGYEPYTAPSTLSFTFSGLVLPTAPTTCGAGSHYVNGECVAYATENCDSGFYKDAQAGAAFYGKDGDTCPSGYEPYTAPSALRFVFNGLVMASAPTVCASGHYVNGTCTAYSSTGCITGYVDAGTDGVVASVDENAACPTDYTDMGLYQSCTATTTDSVCTTLCNGGMLQTAAGYCATKCGMGLSKWHIGDLVTYRVYGTQTTWPSVKVSDGTTICYVNVVPGRASGAVNISDGTNIWHVTD